MPKPTIAELQAEINRMRPVYRAAMLFASVFANEEPLMSNGILSALLRACEKAKRGKNG